MRSTTMLGTRAIGLRESTVAHERDDVVGRDLLLVREARPLGHPGRDETWRDRRRTDAVLGLLAVQRARPGDERRLRRAVDGESRRRNRSGDRGERDDLAARFAQQRQGLACDHERCPQVHVELQVDLLRLLLRERSADADAGAVHEDVHAAVAFGVRGDNAHALVGVAQVCGHRKRIQLCGGRLERLGPPSCERERVPVRRAAREQSPARFRTIHPLPALTSRSRVYGSTPGSDAATWP